MCGCRSDFQKIVAKINALDYTIPDKLQLSDSAKDLIAQARPSHSLRLHMCLCARVCGVEACAAALASKKKAGAGRSRFNLSVQTVSTWSESVLRFLSWRVRRVCRSL